MRSIRPQICGGRPRPWPGAAGRLGLARHSRFNVLLVQQEPFRAARLWFSYPANAYGLRLFRDECLVDAPGCCIPRALDRLGEKE